MVGLSAIIAVFCNTAATVNAIQTSLSQRASKEYMEAVEHSFAPCLKRQEYVSSVTQWKTAHWAQEAQKFLRIISHWNVVSKVHGFFVPPLLLTFHACAKFQKKEPKEHFIWSNSFDSIWRKLIVKDDYYVGHKGCVKTHLIKERLLGFFFPEEIWRAL